MGGEGVDWFVCMRAMSFRFGLSLNGWIGDLTSTCMTDRAVRKGQYMDPFVCYVVH